MVLYQGAIIQFTAQVSGGVPPYSFAWDFGDGSTGQGQTVTKTFNQAGNFTVTVNVTDSIGNKAQAKAQISINPTQTYQPLTVSIQYTQQQTGLAYQPPSTTPYTAPIIKIV